MKTLEQVQRDAIALLSPRRRESREARAMNRADRRPTHTRLVLQALADWQQDFASIRDLMAATGSSYNQVSAALFHLRARHAVDVVVERDGQAWWFATPGDDDRTKVVDERVPELPGNRSRRVRRNKES